MKSKGAFVWMGIQRCGLARPTAGPDELGTTGDTNVLAFIYAIKLGHICTLKLA